MGTTDCREDSDVFDKVCKVNFPSFLNALLRMPIPGCKNKGVNGVLPEVWCRALWQNEAVFLQHALRLSSAQEGLHFENAPSPRRQVCPGKDEGLNFTDLDGHGRHAWFARLRCSISVWTRRAHVKWSLVVVGVGW